MNKVQEMKDWIDDVMTSITTSMNDVHPSKMYRMIQRKCIDTIQQRIDKNSTATEIKSYLMTPEKHPPSDNYYPDLSNTLLKSGQDADNPNFEMSNWIKDDSFWKPPPPVDPNISFVPPSTTSLSTLHKVHEAQTDSGANRIVVDDLNLLTKIITITPTPMGGCNKNDPAAIVCTHLGYLQLHSTNDTTIQVKAYYSPQVDGTIISPTNIITQLAQDFVGWIQVSNKDTMMGKITLLGRDNHENLDFTTFCKNDLWYHTIDSIGPKRNEAKLNRMSRATQYELWHQRCGHAGSSTMEKLHNHVIGMPRLKGNSLYRCPSCMAGKLCTKNRIGRKNKSFLQRQALAQQALDTDSIHVIKHDDLYLPNIEPGQKFHMDYGFVRGSGFKEEDKQGRTITSIDGYNSYLSIIDRATRYQWLFLTKSKEPQIEIVRRILNKFKSTNPNRQVRVDQGGELGRSNAFKDVIAECDFELELTGSDNSRQNGLVERPNRNLAEAMRCILHASDLGPEFWSFALLHAVYLKNRLYHHTIKSTPYFQFTGNKPDLTHLKIFGSKIYAKRSTKRKYKLDNNVDEGIFLGYTATNQNIIYVDAKTGRFKTATHVIFDEAHMSTPTSNTPIAAQALQRLGYTSKEHEVHVSDTSSINPTCAAQLLTSTAQLPTKSTDGSIGYDIYADNQEPLSILPGKISIVSTGVAIQMPQNCYVRVAPRSGLTIKQHLTTLAGVIDPDYRGDIGVVLQNFGNTTQNIQPGQRIAQLIFENAIQPSIKEVTELDHTKRGNNGFGSTESNIGTINNLSQDLNLTMSKPFDIDLSLDPYDNVVRRNVNILPYDKHPTFGIMAITKNNKLQLSACNSGTSAARLKRWRSELRQGTITAINDNKVTTLAQLKSIFRAIRSAKDTTFTLEISTIDKQAMHPQKGTPQLYHDQMNIIAQHLWDIKNEPEWTINSNEEVVHPVSANLLQNISGKYKKNLKMNKLWYQQHSLPPWYKVAKVKKRRKLTRRYLMKQADWNDWRQSEFKQLNQYKAQNTFGTPQPLPTGANLLPLLWTYIIKDDGTKKARCVCNGSPKMRGSVTLAETYASSLEQTASRIFWATTAIKNFITIGADASNAFAEAPAPKAPLYVQLDQPYKDWYKATYPDQPPLPDDYVLPVNGALQGHPESARLWSKLIDRVIRQLGLKSCTHEPCLYYTDNYKNTGKKVLFLRQVDDFAVACQDKSTASDVINTINSKMTIDVKNLGTITRFNGVDILQSRDYVKIYNQTYINKILTRHDWIHQETSTPSYPIPMKNDPKYLKLLETQPIPTDNDIKSLESEMTFTYRQAIGELIYAMITCRPDISFAVIKLSQYSTKPTRVHFEAVKEIYRYLKATATEGIYYWRQQPRPDLPNHPTPICKPHNNYNPNESDERQQNHATTLRATVDSDYASDTSHRRSVTGITMKLGGGAIYYKTRYQDCQAHSSTEAEFTAAADAGKQILYVRSLLEQIGIPQHNATILYEDNQGALLMAKSQQPTRRTRHMDIKAFAIQDWVERDLIILQRINTSDNEADSMTKATDRTLFYRHNDFIMGKVKPAYTYSSQNPHINKMSLAFPIKVISKQGRVSYADIR